MAYGGVEYTYKYTPFLHKYALHFTVKIMFCAVGRNTDNCIYLRVVE